eukprot:SAG31_NODE_5682_length_2383_cov_1.567426_2_plen_260_part_00
MSVTRVRPSSPRRPTAGVRPCHTIRRGAGLLPGSLRWILFLAGSRSLSLSPLPCLQEYGYCCVRSLSIAELSALNSVCDEWVTTRGPEIDVPGQGQVRTRVVALVVATRTLASVTPAIYTLFSQLFFPLLYYPEVDFTVVHPSTKPLVGAILGGWDKARLIEFNYRGWEPELNPRADGTFAPRPKAMAWHPDGVPGVSAPLVLFLDATVSSSQDSLFLNLRLPVPGEMFAERVARRPYGKLSEIIDESKFKYLNYIPKL